MAIRKEVIDELNATSRGSPIGPDGIVEELTKALVERMLAGENHHLGYEKHDVAGYGSRNLCSGNLCNGKTNKMLKGKLARSGSRCRGTAMAPSSRS